ncbi:MAG: hypothetical protein ACSLEX_00730 [Minisyncoccota bacterium]
MKKIFYFSSGFLILFLIFWLAYNFAFKNNINNPSITSSETDTLIQQNDFSKNVPSATVVFTNPLNESLLGATVSANNRLFYYSLDDQSIKSASLEGKDKEVLMSHLPGTPERIIWSPKKDQALLLLKQGSMSLWHLIDIGTKTLTPLKTEMSRIVWNNLGDKILYQYTDQVTKKRTLNISDPDGKNWKTLTDIKSDSFIAPIPQSTSISFWNKPNALEKTFFESISVLGGDRRILLTEKFGADYLWSPDGDKVLVSATTSKGGGMVLLQSMNSNGGELKSLSVPTLISKAVWSSDGKTIYYALPGALPENVMLPNDYFEKPIFTKDTFWKIDTSTGKQSRLVDLQDITQNIDSADLFLSPKEDILFFTNRNTRKLYRIDL